MEREADKGGPTVIPILVWKVVGTRPEPAGSLAGKVRIPLDPVGLEYEFPAQVEHERASVPRGKLKGPVVEPLMLVVPHV